MRVRGETSAAGTALTHSSGTLILEGEGMVTGMLLYPARRAERTINARRVHTGRKSIQTDSQNAERERGIRLDLETQAGFEQAKRDPQKGYTCLYSSAVLTVYMSGQVSLYQKFQVMT